MRLMFVHAHPDDEASKGAGTAAKYAAQGHRVRIVTATGGERGDILNPNLADDCEVKNNLTAIRREEMATAARALGVEHIWLGFVDSGLPEGDPLPDLPAGSFAALDLDDVVPAFVAQLREFRPQVLVTYNEQGGYPHPDHIRTHTMTMAAVDAAADPAYQPELGAPWLVNKLYYDVGFSLARLEALHQALGERGLPSPYTPWIAARTGIPQRPVTARIEVSEYFPNRDAALRAHATQIDPNGFFFAMPRDIEREAWPWDEFELVRSTVPTRAVEACLFEGLTPSDE